MPNSSVYMNMNVTIITKKKKGLYALSTPGGIVPFMSAFDGENWPVCM
jgi:hypothetical protein